jgi:hypothetical protein
MLDADHDDHACLPKVYVLAAIVVQQSVKAQLS